MKRFLAALLAASLAFAACCCAAPQQQAEGGEVTVVATLFPQFDFARRVAGERATVTLLLPPGLDSHSFEPTPADIVRLGEADVVLYTGEHMEPWMEQLKPAMEKPPVDVSAGIELAAVHHHELDPHIWTDPLQAVTMVQNIAAALSAADPAGKEAYQANAAAYIAELEELHLAIQSAVEGFASRTICFGGRFAMHYFTERYGLSCISAYDSCSEETEPSARAVAEVVEAVRSQGVKTVFYEELAQPTVALAIAEEAGVKAELLHSCHNVTKEELEAGASYLSLMYQNLEKLKEGLS